MMKCEWILCPVCGSKTRNKIRKDTVLENYPLYIAVIVKNATKNGIKLQLTIKKIEKLKKMFMKILNRK